MSTIEAADTKLRDDAAAVVEAEGYSRTPEQIAEAIEILRLTRHEPSAHDAANFAIGMFLRVTR